MANKVLKVSAPVAAATAHGVRMAANLLIVKMIAIWVGPAGMGLLGQFMSLSSLVSVFAGGGIGNGITKYVAEYRSQPRRLIRFLGSAVTYGLLFSILILVASLLFAKPASQLLFGDFRYAWLMPFLGIAHALCFIGVAVIAIANGLRRPDIFAGITIVGYIGSLPFAYLLIRNFGIEGSALALMIVLACTAFPACWFIYRSRLRRHIRLRIDRADTSRLAKYSVMMIASATLFPATEIFIRTNIIGSLGLDSAGIWQAMTRLSGAYLGFFTVYLATSYMPRLSALKHRPAIIQTVLSQLKIVGLTFVCAAIAIYLMRELVIRLLFSSEFAAMSQLFGWQLMGDLFRVSAYVIGFLGVAKAATRIYIAAEILQVSIYASLSYFVLNNGGNLINLVQAYALTYLLYFLLTVAALFVYSRQQYDIRR